MRSSSSPANSVQDTSSELVLLLRPGTPLPPLPTAPSAFLSHEQLFEHHGTHPADLAILEDFTSRHSLRLTEVDSPPTSAARTARLSGPRKVLLHLFPPASPGASTSSPLPSALRNIVEAVLHDSPAHLTSRPRASHVIHCPAPEPPPLRTLRSAYRFPPHHEGEGQTIGLIELGGGFRPGDIAAFCRLQGLPVPRITVVPVRSGGNLPAPAHSIHQMLDCVDGHLSLAASALDSAWMEQAQATVEVTMDIQIVAALAPAAHIIVYFAPAGTNSLFHALSAAIHDTRNRPSIVSISWGEPENALSPDSLHAVDQLLLTACHLGITVCASSGDAGALNNSPDHLPAVNFPASSPHCLACGGTSTRLHHQQDEVHIHEEIVWNSTHFGLKGATGGGVSRYFPPPPWQHGAHVPHNPLGHPGRGVPDVAGPADPRFGFQIFVAGRTCASAGTSAVAPIWASLIACCNQALETSTGHLNPHLYRMARQLHSDPTHPLRPVTEGNNDFYSASTGWNPCAGLGTPIGTHLLQHLRTALNAS